VGAAHKQGKAPFPQFQVTIIRCCLFKSDLHDEPDFLDFPWDYQLFDSNPTDNGRWEFTLVSHVLEIVFEAEWPTFTKK
jgi:hypothetical protein